MSIASCTNDSVVFPRRAACLAVAGVRMKPGETEKGREGDGRERERKREREEEERERELSKRLMCIERERKFSKKVN